MWSIAAPQHAVFDALADLAAYPRWWPDVRAVTQLDRDTAAVRCRAVLPYTLDLLFHRAEADRAAGRLRIELTGDLHGYCGCRLAGDRRRTLVEVDQHVELRKPALQRAERVVPARVLGLAYRANHAAMMARGQRGLRAYLVEQL